MSDEINELHQQVKGWGKPGHSDEEHYFIGTRSLCGKWALFSSSLKPKTDINLVTCNECIKRKIIYDHQGRKRARSLLRSRRPEGPRKERKQEV